MTLIDLHPALKEALCLFEAFRRCGYPSDDIYLVYGNDVNGINGLFVEAHWGDGRFTATAGPWDGQPDSLSAEWEDAAFLWNNGNASEIDPLWLVSHVRNHAVAFALALSERGLLRVTPKMT